MPINFWQIKRKHLTLSFWPAGQCLPVSISHFVINIFNFYCHCCTNLPEINIIHFVLFYSIHNCHFIKKYIFYDQEYIGGEWWDLWWWAPCCCCWSRERWWRPSGPSSASPARPRTTSATAHSTSRPSSSWTTSARTASGSTGTRMCTPCAGTESNPLLPIAFLDQKPDVSDDLGCTVIP